MNTANFVFEQADGLGISLVLTKKLKLLDLNMYRKNVGCCRIFSSCFASKTIDVRNLAIFWTKFGNSSLSVIRPN